jgi:hypothetical protein
MRHDRIRTHGELEGIVARQSDRNLELVKRLEAAEIRERSLALENARLRTILKDNGINL